MSTITKALAHVVNDENLFVRNVAKVATDHFESEFTIDGTHPYLYENAAIANHVSGTTFLDTSRQLLKAISHLFYAVPLANRFVIRAANLDFTRWAKIGVPIQASVQLVPSEKTMSGQTVLSFTGSVTWHQDGWQIGVLSGKFMTLPAAIEDQLMQPQYRQVSRIRDALPVAEPATRAPLACAETV